MGGGGEGTRFVGVLAGEAKAHGSVQEAEGAVFTEHREYRVCVPGRHSGSLWWAP